MRKNFEKGRPTPAWENRPTLFEDLQHVWDSFWILNRSRQVGFSPSGLSICDVIAWLDLNVIEGADERLEFVTWVLFLDSLMLKRLNEKVKQDADRKRSPKGDNRRTRRPSRRP